MEGGWTLASPTVLGDAERLKILLVDRDRPMLAPCNAGVSRVESRKPPPETFLP
jgi:hypothetical protein